MISLAQQPELLIRGATIGILVALAASLLREPKAPARLTGALFCLGATGHTITQSPTIMATLGIAAAPAWVFATMAGGLFWAVALELFGDTKGIRLRRFLPAVILLLIALAAASTPHDIGRYFWLAQNVIIAGLMIHVLVVTWSGLRDDLVEPRRRLRGPVIAAAAVYALAICAVQSIELFSRPATELSLLTAVLLFVLSFSGLLVFLRADERLFRPPAKTAAMAGLPATSAVPPQDRATLEKLRKALDEDELWRREDLCIGDLAQAVGVPEHRLRKIINEGLGYRNFATFLGERRVSAAKAALADPEKARKPVSSIAFDVGFNSLASFNRVFRDTTGTTPTAYRQQALNGSSNPENPPQN
jgi:AraC-like DNA-binding protein